MGLLSLLAQVCGIGVALYLAFTKSMSRGVILCVIIWAGHIAFTNFANLLMLLHQRSLSSDAKQELQLRAQYEGLSATPSLWKHIANVCGALYIGLVGAAIWYFLVG